MPHKFVRDERGQTLSIPSPLASVVRLEKDELGGGACGGTASEGGAGRMRIAEDRELLFDVAVRIARSRRYGRGEKGKVWVRSWPSESEALSSA